MLISGKPKHPLLRPTWATPIGALARSTNSVFLIDQFELRLKSFRGGVRSESVLGRRATNEQLGSTRDIENFPL